MILDVGCGWNYKGNVNVDLFLQKDISHREDEQKIYKNWKKRNVDIPNLICADSNCLPIRRNVFDTVFCCHTLEHKGVDLIKTCKELLRVAKGRIVITVPSMLSASADSTLHDKIFTAKAFHILFNQFERKVTYVCREWSDMNFPSRYLIWIIRKISNLLKFIPCPVYTEILCEVKKC